MNLTITNNPVKLGVVVVLAKQATCLNCGCQMDGGTPVKHLRGVGYEHLNCDALAATKQRHPANRIR
jgi:hypothetical protein